jgi:insulysin
MHSKDYNPNEQNSAIEILYFSNRSPGAKDYENTTDVIFTSALLTLVQHLMSEPAFDQLRTKEQLGYIVNVSTRAVGEIECLRVVVQSNHKDPVYLDQRVELFLQSYFDNVILTMTDEFLQTNINAVIENLLEPVKNIDKVKYVL